MDKQLKTNPAVRRAVDKYEERFERVNCYFDKGTVERIKKLGYSSNAFIMLAVAEKLASDEAILEKKK